MKDDTALFKLVGAICVHLNINPEELALSLTKEKDTASFLLKLTVAFGKATADKQGENLKQEVLKQTEELEKKGEELIQTIK